MHTRVYDYARYCSRFRPAYARHCHSYANVRFGKGADVRCRTATCTCCSISTYFRNYVSTCTSFSSSACPHTCIVTGSYRYMNMRVRNWMSICACASRKEWSALR